MDLDAGGKCGEWCGAGGMGIGEVWLTGWMGWLVVGNICVYQNIIE